MSGLFIKPKLTADEERKQREQRRDEQRRREVDAKRQKSEQRKASERNYRIARKTAGNVLAAARRKKGETVFSVASFLGIEFQTYGHYENGDRMVPARVWIKLQRLFGDALPDLWTVIDPALVRWDSDRWDRESVEDRHALEQTKARCDALRRYGGTNDGNARG